MKKKNFNWISGSRTKRNLCNLQKYNFGKVLVCCVFWETKKVGKKKKIMRYTCVSTFVVADVKETFPPYFVSSHTHEVVSQGLHVIGRRQAAKGTEHLNPERNRLVFSFFFLLSRVCSQLSHALCGTTIREGWGTTTVNIGNGRRFVYTGCTQRALCYLSLVEGKRLICTGNSAI